MVTRLLNFLDSVRHSLHHYAPNLAPSTHDLFRDMINGTAKCEIGTRHDGWLEARRAAVRGAAAIPLPEPLRAETF